MLVRLLELLNTMPGFESEFLDGGLGLIALFAGVFRDFFQMNTHDIAEVLDHLLLEVEAGVEAGDGLKILGEGVFKLLLTAGCFGGKLLYDGRCFLVEDADLFAMLGESLHVALTAFDLLVEDDAVETLFAAHQLVCQGEVAIGGEAEEVEILLNLDLGIFDAL